MSASRRKARPAPVRHDLGIVLSEIAGGARAILIDVKCGAGAFCRTRRQARQLAQACLILAAERLGAWCAA